MNRAKNLRTCDKGHKYYKSSDCPVCPVCDKAQKPKDGFLALISAPARRALENAGISTLAGLSKYSEEELLKLHGMGPGTISKLFSALQEQGLTLKKK